MLLILRAFLKQPGVTFFFVESSLGFKRHSRKQRVQKTLNVGKGRCFLERCLQLTINQKVFNNNYNLFKKV